ncbi:hypothetical protein ACLKA7_013712 [Drosophila subpalustris]
MGSSLWARSRRHLAALAPGFVAIPKFVYCHQSALGFVHHALLMPQHFIRPQERQKKKPSGRNGICKDLKKQRMKELRREWQQEEQEQEEEQEQ